MREGVSVLRVSTSKYWNSKDTWTTLLEKMRRFSVRAAHNNLAPTALIRVTLLFIPGTFGTAPCETQSYSRGELDITPLSKFSPCPTWPLDPLLSGWLTSISSLPAQGSFQRHLSWCPKQGHAVRLSWHCVLPSWPHHSLEFILCVAALVCLSTSLHLPMERTIMVWLTSESPAWHPAWYTVGDQ